MMIALIILSLNGQPTSQVFNSMEACVKAKEWVLRTKPKPKAECFKLQ